MTMAAVTMTRVSGMRRGTYVIGKTNGGRITMSIPIRASNWIINASHAKRMSRKDFFERIDKFCLYGSCKWMNT